MRKRVAKISAAVVGAYVAFQLSFWVKKLVVPLILAI